MGVANRGAPAHCFPRNVSAQATRETQTRFRATLHVFVPTEYNFRLPNFLWIVCEGQTRYLALFVNAL